MQRNKQYQDERVNNAVEELKSYCALLREAEESIAKANEYRERYDYGLRARAFDGVMVDNGSVRDTMVDTILQWADLEVLANTKRLEAENVLWAIKYKLEKLLTDERSVLTLYYIKGYNSEQIANVMRYSYQWVKWAKLKAIKSYAALNESLATISHKEY